MLIHINTNKLYMSILFSIFVVEKETNNLTPKTRKGTKNMKQTIMEVLKKIHQDGLENLEWDITDREVMSQGFYGTLKNIELKPHLSVYVETYEEVNEWPLPDELMSLRDSNEKLLVYYV